MPVLNRFTNQSTRNIFDIMQEQLESRPTYEIIIESTIGILVIAVAFFGNLLTLIVVYRNRSLRTIQNMFAVSMAIVDMLMGITVVLMATVVMVTSKWIFSSFACHFQAFTIVFTSVISLLSIMMTSLNRYFKVVKNNLYSRYFSKKKALRMIVSSWICGCLVPVPLLLPGATVFNPSKLVCFLDATSQWRFYLAPAITVLIALPLTVTIYCYIQIYRTVANHQSTTFQSRTSTTSVQEIKITHMTLVTVLCFVICWTPAFVINMIDSARANFTLPRTVYIVHSFGVGFSCALNPVVYGLMNPTFRREYLKVLRWEKTSNKVSPTSLATSRH